MNWYLAVALPVAGGALALFVRSYLSEKGKNLATREDIQDITNKIEQVRALFATQIHIAQHRYQNEYAILLQLSESVVDTREATKGLRPEAEYYDPKESREAALDRKWKRYTEAARKLRVLSETRRPFYPDNLYKLVSQLNSATIVEVSHFNLEATGHKVDSQHKNVEAVIAAAEEVLKAIRVRVVDWEAQGSETPEQSKHARK